MFTEVIDSSNAGENLASKNKESLAEGTGNITLATYEVPYLLTPRYRVFLGKLTGL